MFKKSRRKIVAAIMTVLVLLWLGTLCVIYGSSYYEVLTRNREMLKRHAELYLLEQQPVKPFSPGKQEPAGGPPRPENTPAFQLSTFYSVAIAKDGKVLEIQNTQTGIYTNQELEEIAGEVMKENKPTGIKHNLVYHVADKGFYTLVAFMDNTIVQESMTTLFRYTLIFGGLAIVALFFLAVYLAKKIVQPLEESHQKQKQFISDAGHELKTPVSIVSANAELLAREIGENQWLGNIQYENERMGILVGQLLELARAESVTPQMEIVDLGRLVSGEALPFESIVFENGRTLRCEISAPLWIKGNAVQLKQLTAILLDNALQHGEAGTEILLTLKKERSAAALSVVNEGEAIPDEQKKQMFDRFYRMDTVRNGEEKHYGLGLAIAKAIVDSHGGSIDVQCEDHKVEFRVILPLQN
ncbi:sensor histidine kinase [Hominifimenecus sp. rT4P-3]|uniref:sensor histidine kinase n=1 Tax=Hominifimenecus sp. rT4P-3 TaxID=3242979 RepID=UPI003DA2062D